MQALNGLAASRKFTKLAPLTIRPSLMSRQGIIRLQVFQDSFEIYFNFVNNFSTHSLIYTIWRKSFKLFNTVHG